MNPKNILKRLEKMGGCLISNERDGFAYSFSCYENELSLCSMDHNNQIGFDVKWENVKINGSEIEVEGIDEWNYKIFLNMTMVVPFNVEN